jgi:lantibiotic modifying enzyme
MTNALKALYTMLSSIRKPTTILFNHGDPKFDNYMINGDSLRMIDLGFAHYEDNEGRNITASVEFNGNNNDIPRDLVHNLMYIYLVYGPETLHPDLRGIARDVEIQLDAMPAAQKTAQKQWDVYEYLNTLANNSDIRAFIKPEFVSLSKSSIVFQYFPPFKKMVYGNR